MQYNIPINKTNKKQAVYCELALCHNISQCHGQKNRSSPPCPPLLGPKMEAKTHPKAVRS
eukprot:4602200-Karenia_brevis.AAC.1